MKRSAIINTVIGLLWIIGGIVAFQGGGSLALFGIIPIPTSLVIALGAIWTILGIRALFAKPAAVEPAAEPEQYQVPPTQPYPQQYPPQESFQIPQYAPRDPEGPTPI